MYSDSDISIGSRKNIRKPWCSFLAKRLYAFSFHLILNFSYNFLPVFFFNAIEERHEEVVREWRYLVIIIMRAVYHFNIIKFSSTSYIDSRMWDVLTHAGWPACQPAVYIMLYIVLYLYKWRINGGKTSNDEFLCDTSWFGSGWRKRSQDF